MKIADILGMALYYLILILLSPIWLPLGAYSYISRKFGDRRFQTFLRTTASAKYFCYTNKANSELFVREHVLPFLPLDVQVLYASGRRHHNIRKSNAIDDRIIGKMSLLKKGFPCIAKVSNRTLITESLNRELFIALTQNKNGDEVNEKIAQFFANEPK
jgi:hypothetical protein